MVWIFILALDPHSDVTEDWSGEDLSRPPITFVLLFWGKRWKFGWIGLDTRSGIFLSFCFFYLCFPPICWAVPARIWIGSASIIVRRAWMSLNGIISKGCLRTVTRVFWRGLKSQFSLPAKLFGAKHEAFKILPPSKIFSLSFLVRIIEHNNIQYYTLARIYIWIQKGGKKIITQVAILSQYIKFRQKPSII